MEPGSLGLRHSGMRLNHWLGMGGVIFVVASLLSWKLVTYIWS